jgi:putative nucleotidyltransferase with HDIG domain
MSKRDQLSWAAQVYVACVVAAGILAVAHSFLSLVQDPVGHKWLMLAGLTLLSGSFTVRIPGIPAHLSVSETFVFVAVLMFGPAAATMIVVLDTLVISFWLRRRTNHRPLQLAFNVAAPSVAIWVASHCFYWATGIQPLLDSSHPDLTLVVPLLGLATLYFLLNSSLVAVAVASQKKKPAFLIWKQSFLWLSLNFYSGASVAALLLPYLQQHSGNTLWYIAGVLLPVLLISYLTFKTALARDEDANKHLLELNRLYISTIETLAMAIDAKDQITHGHIRRVQRYAVGLARHIGVTDGGQISAIEAASLLHDMGKLAVPEYILNKPGKLTRAEFERMKLHASVGADILTAIDFPYPVVPIVRHHHENWDGTGYPDGLRGTGIPIGARILSVVDCFDALTSDRPYRPRLSDTDAIQILRDRRGSMYDPLIVDAFLEVYPELSQEISYTADTSLDELSALSVRMGARDSSVTTSAFNDIAGSAEEMLVLYELANGLTAHIGFGDVADLIAKHLRRIVPFSLSVFYIYESDSNELVAYHAAGVHESSVSGLHIPMGGRLSGWVAANRRSIINSDPLLDLGSAATRYEPRLLSCLSAPMAADVEVVGVLTLYSDLPDAFSEDHRRVLEVVAKQVAHSVKNAVLSVPCRPSQVRDHVTSLPTLAKLERLLEAEAAAIEAGGYSLIIVRLCNAREALVDADRSLPELASVIRQALRAGDLLFKNGDDEFVVLLTDTTSETASLICGRLVDRVRHMLSDAAHCWLGTALIVGAASAPADGRSLQEMLATARSRSAPPFFGNVAAVH